MSLHTADALIAREIEKLADSPTPAADRCFVEGMIEMACALEHLSYADAESYRQALAIKAGNRIDAIRKSGS